MIDTNVESLRTIAGHRTYAQAHQDLFVRFMLGFKRNGRYVEIGAAEPKQSSNTYILEAELGWTGVSLEISQPLVDEFVKQRTNPCLCADATTLDYAKMLAAHGFPRQIDYLSVDIDPASVTYQALTRVPHADYRFSVITYEHDMYESGTEYMLKSRAYLENLGYVRVVSNVRCRGRDFEDWYVDPAVVPSSVYQPFVGADLECADIFKGK